MEDTIEQVDTMSEEVNTDSPDGSEQVETVEQEQPKEQPPQGRDTTIEVDGRQYKVSENTIRKYWNVPPDADLSDREFKTLLSGYKQAIHFNNATRETKNQQAQIQQFVTAFEQDPKGTLKQMFQSDNARLRQLAEEIVLEQMEEEMLDPREKELRDLRSEKERYAQELERQKQQLEQEKLEEESRKYGQQWENEIIQILDSSPKLAKIERTVHDLLGLKKVALEQGMEVPFDKISKKVEQDYMTISSNIIQNSTPEELYEMIGAEKMKQIRNLDLQRVKKIGSPVPQSSQSSPSGKPKSITPEEFRAQAKQRLAKFSM